MELGGETGRQIYFVDNIGDTEKITGKLTSLDELTRGTYNVKVVGKGEERKEEALSRGQVRRIINSVEYGEIYIQRVGDNK